MNEAEKIRDAFLSVPMRPGTMLYYGVRRSILESVVEETRSFHGTVLDVGCGVMPYRGIVENNQDVTKYIGLDLEQPAYYGHVEPDLKWDGVRIPLEDSSVDCVMATEFLEHYADTEGVLREMRRVLKDGGKFFATVPFIWNLHEVPYDEYRFTPYSIERHLKNAGFADMEIKALGGWNLSFAQMIGLWTAFSKRTIARRMLKLILFPLYAWLVRSDEKPARFDGAENSMFSGLSITARK